MKSGIQLFTAAALLIFATTANAAADGKGFRIGLSAMKDDQSTEGSTIGTRDYTTTVFHLKAGMVLDNGVYVGGIYDSRTDDSGTSKAERTGYGATLGYHSSGWFIDGSYYLSSTISYSSGTKLEGGSGFGVDLGYNFNFTEHLFAGLQLSYKSFTYTKVGSIDQTNKLKSELMPMLNIGVTF